MAASGLGAYNGTSIAFTGLTATTAYAFRFQDTNSGQYYVVMATTDGSGNVTIKPPANLNFNYALTVVNINANTIAYFTNADNAGQLQFTEVGASFTANSYSSPSQLPPTGVTVA